MSQIKSTTDLLLYSTFQDSLTMSAIRTTILFHGNCIDGWFSAYFAYCALQTNGSIQMFPISPSQSNTWPHSEEMEGTMIWLLDVSVPKDIRDNWMKSGAAGIRCIDHHASAKAHWECCDHNPINTESCAALQTFRHFFPGQVEPAWLHSIDRVDRWVNVTHEDRCLREYLHGIAKLPVQKKFQQAMEMTNSFVYYMTNHPETITMYQQNGQEALNEKDAKLKALMEQHGHVITIDSSHVQEWQLPITWLNKKMFLMNTTDISLDTTEASHLIFLHNPTIDIFINYRKNAFFTKLQWTSRIVYHARSRSLDLTEGTIFQGHPTAAGASLTHGEVTHFPFMLHPSHAEPIQNRQRSPVPFPILM